MRVAFVNSMRSMGGGETWLLEAARGLRARGHEPAVVVRSGAELGVAASKEGHEVVEMPMKSDFDPASVLRLSAWLRKFRPDVVSVNIQRAVRIGCAAAKLAGVRGIVERRGLNFDVRSTSVNRWVYGRCLSLVIANCAAIRDDLLRSGLIGPDRVAVVPNGIDAARVPAGGGEGVRLEFGIAADAPVVAVVGRLVPDKGHRDAIDTFSRVASALPEARLIVVGDGKLRGELEDVASRVAPEGSVVFVGFREDVPAVLDAADVLLVSSYREGSPHVVLEAMAAGTPVVATAVAGIPEMLEDGRSGVLVPVGATTDAAAAVVGLLGDRARADAMAESALERVRGRFSLSAMVDEIERHFENVADQAHRLKEGRS